MQVLLGILMAVVAPLVLDKDKDVRSAAVSTLQVIVARAVKEAEVFALTRALHGGMNFLTACAQAMNAADASLSAAHGLTARMGELQKKKSEVEKKAPQQQQQQQQSDDDDGSWDAITGVGSSAPGLSPALPATV